MPILLGVFSFIKSPLGGILGIGAAIALAGLLAMAGLKIHDKNNVIAERDATHKTDVLKIEQGVRDLATVKGNIAQLTSEINNQNHRVAELGRVSAEHTKAAEKALAALAQARRTSDQLSAKLLAMPTTGDLILDADLALLASAQP